MLNKHSISWATIKYNKNQNALAKFIVLSYAGFVIFCYVYIAFAVL